MRIQLWPARKNHFSIPARECSIGGLGRQWVVLWPLQQKIVKDGKTLETPEENLAELTSQAQTFADKRLPILKALQVV